MTKTHDSGLVYGVFWFKKIIGSHQFAYFVTHGSIPIGKLICHTCDTPLCCNPAHLFAGTYLDNNRDACLKGRHAVGEAMPNSKITDAAALELRARYRPFVVSYQRLAEEFGVSASAVQAVVERRTWKHI
jgi:hypothetical protein